MSEEAWYLLYFMGIVLTLVGFSIRDERLTNRYLKTAIFWACVWPISITIITINHLRRRKYGR